MEISKHAGFWLAVIVAVFLLAPVFRSAESMEMFASVEVAATKSVFGEWTAQQIVKQARGLQKLLPIKSVSKMQTSDEGMDRTKKVMPGPAVAVMTTANAYFSKLATGLFVLAVRACICVVWLFVLAPVLVATVVDGLVKRAIKRDEFGDIRPAAFSAANLIIVPLSFAPVGYLVAPVLVPPMVIPVWALIMILPLSFMVSNMQPIFGNK